MVVVIIPGASIRKKLIEENSITKNYYLRGKNIGG